VLQQHEYKRDIRPGQPLKWGDLAERSLVRKGQVVDVIAYQGMIGISMRAKAQQDGVRGEMVFLSNLESNKNFSGEVIGEGRVQVTF
jgi:flagella basal body P-ring formation protein FlgA